MIVAERDATFDQALRSPTAPALEVQIDGCSGSPAREQPPEPFGVRRRELEIGALGHVRSETLDEDLGGRGDVEVTDLFAVMDYSNVHQCRLRAEMIGAGVHLQDEPRGAVSTSAGLPTGATFTLRE